MLPEPTLTFTIPSIQDNVLLDCRVYHPTSLTPTAKSHCTEWNRKAAIVAHPYAPLGGSYDDPIVEIIASLLLKENFVVGTFNFRGAGASKGRTSWQGKAEQKDYMSFLAFMVYYCHLLSPQQMPFDIPAFVLSEPDLHHLTPVPSQAIVPPRSKELPLSAEYPPMRKADSGVGNTQPRLLLAGYSYGALMTSLLPPIIDSMIQPFQSPKPGSAHAEIRLRAESLAAQQTQEINAQISNLLLTSSHRRGRSLHNDETLYHSKIRKTSGVRIGGEEDLRRASHESFLGMSSFSIEAPELVRRSVDRVRSLGHRRLSPKRHDARDSVTSFTSKRASRHYIDEKDPDAAAPKPIPGIVNHLQMAYLLVSPLQGLVNSLATMWSSRSWKEKESISAREMKFTVDPTLAVFGDDDAFVSVKKLRPWAENLTQVSRGRGTFRYAEVAGAGHFWHDGGAVRILQDEVRAFVRGL